MMLDIIVATLSCCVLATPITIIVLDKLRHDIRAKKHPKYFELYNAAMKICSNASAKMDHDKSSLEYHFELVSEGLIDGECTEEYFKEQLKSIVKRYIEISRLYKEQQEEAERLFKEADIYAKKNNLSWGIIYK